MFTISPVPVIRAYSMVANLKYLALSSMIKTSTCEFNLSNLFQFEGGAVRSAQIELSKDKC